jgi:hypothetical protein
VIQVQQKQQKQEATGTPDVMHITVRDVTGMHHATLELDPQLRVGAVAEAVAEQMALPADASWALRDESTAAFLDDEVAIGDAVDSQDRTSVSLVATPRAHLG